MSGLNPTDRRMKYPYTYMAKLVNFPYAHYYKHAWLTKYYLIGFVLTLPIMVKITNLAKSPENVAKWHELRKQQFYGGHH